MDVFPGDATALNAYAIGIRQLIWGFICEIITKLGAYSTSPLPATSYYDVRVEADGFVPQTHSHVSLTPGHATQIDFKLEALDSGASGAAAEIRATNPRSDKASTLTPHDTPVVLVRGFGPFVDWSADDSNSWAANSRRPRNKWIQRVGSK